MVRHCADPSSRANDRNDWAMEAAQALAARRRDGLRALESPPRRLLRVRDQSSACSITSIATWNSVVLSEEQHARLLDMLYAFS